jgi:hypothetical protein
MAASYVYPICLSHLSSLIDLFATLIVRNVLQAPWYMGDSTLDL